MNGPLEPLQAVDVPEKTVKHMILPLRYAKAFPRSVRPTELPHRLVLSTGSIRKLVWKEIGNSLWIVLSIIPTPLAVGDAEV